MLKIILGVYSDIRILTPILQHYPKYMDAFWLPYLVFNRFYPFIIQTLYLEINH